MRTFMNGVAILALMTIAFGCASNEGSKDSGKSAAKTGMPQGSKACTLQSGGRDVLLLTVSTDVTCAPRDSAVHMELRNHSLDIWLVDGATKVDQGVGRVNQQIAQEFKDFKPAGTTTMTVAGSPAKRLTGPGTEADDGDPGSADIIVFQTGGRIFIACTHGESLAPAARQWMQTVVESAKAP